LRVPRAPIVGAVIAAIVVAAFLPTGSQAQQSITLTMSELNGSGVSGTAMLMPMGSQTQVTVELQSAPGPHPIHIHEGTCANLNPAVKFPLTAVQNGRSETMVAASVDQLLAMQHSINAHKSPQEASVYNSCGTITAAAAAAPAAQPKPGAPPSPAPKPATAPAPAAPAPATKPAAPAQAPKPGASPAAVAPAGLPRTGDADNTSFLILATIGGLGLVGAGAFALQRRRSA